MFSLCIIMYSLLNIKYLLVFGYACVSLLLHDTVCCVEYLCVCTVFQPGLCLCAVCVVGTPQKEWELNEKMKELESEHQQRLHQIDTMEQPLKWDRLAVSDGLGKGGTAPSISSTIDAFTTQHVDSLAVDLARQVNLYKEQVEYKTRLTETLVHHKKEKAN